MIKRTLTFGIMISLGKIFSKYTGSLRAYKWVYVLNNLLNSKQLQHNRPLYKKYGVRKSIFSSISHNDLPATENGIPWLDQANAKEKLKAHPDYTTFSSEIQEQLLHFIDEGYMILKGFFSDEQVATLNEEVDQLLKSKTLDFNYTGRKIMESYKVSKTADQVFFKNQELLSLLNFTMGKTVIPFHTINFIEGSEQRAHSDSIHMTTHPLGYLIASWTALEPVGRHNGTLFFYPKSHLLPYVTTEDFPAGNTRWRIGQNSNKKYEDHIEQLIEQHGLEKRYFNAEPGDILIWHANLIHGGSAIEQNGATRKSMVAHYFCEDVICYHEISQRPALMPL
ncbi:MAG: phytanoyl-CoA dioxygenase family protein [Chitinophagales bacterium]|nr:phytanoyl-CoA dioxygenase family protein [Chitinophagales bacterium]